MNPNFALTAIFCAACGVPALAAGVLEPGPNGLGGIWDARYHASSLAAADDTDGDGFSNAAEAAAGTDPFDAVSHPALKIVSFTAADITLEAATQPGKNYRLTTAASLGAADWTAVGDPVPATGATLSFTAPRTASAGFFRVEISDADSDGDGLDDWSELQLAGFDARSGDSFGSGTPGNDLAVAQAMLHSLAAGDITSGATPSAAYEKEGSDAVVTYTRNSPTTYPFTLFVKTAAPTGAAQSAAEPGRYTVKDGTGAALVQRLVIPAGADSASLHVHASPDDRTQVPRHLHFLIGACDLDNDVTLADAAPTPENQRLLVAYLHASAGVQSLGGGMATIRLQGDNDSTLITVSFSNLASPVTSTQVLDGSSSILVSIPAENYGGEYWGIRAAQTFTTDQQLLDALLTGGIHLSIYTETHASGEIEGFFQPTAGSTEFQVPPAPAPITSLTGSDLDRDILRFLTQATYGPSPASLADMQARVAAKNGDRLAAYSTWIDEQFALPAPSLLAYTTAANQQEIQIRAALPASDPNYSAAYDPNSGNRRRGWWLSALSGRDQLPQRLAFALSQIFVISDTDSLVAGRAYGSASYYDMLRSKETGTYRQLLDAVSKHPMMGYYLSHLRNQKAVLAKDGTVLTYP
ncbi:MAG: hypothetical protein JWO82_2736, partial [Akkermansiaceae bacterium]|nr:hypothetical protein [Akkermansiaceae bacterium]